MKGGSSTSVSEATSETSRNNIRATRCEELLLRFIQERSALSVAAAPCQTERSRHLSKRKVIHAGIVHRREGRYFAIRGKYHRSRQGEGHGKDDAGHRLDHFTGHLSLCLSTETMASNARRRKTPSGTAKNERRNMSKPQRYSLQ